MVLCPITSESFRELTEKIAKKICRKDVELEVVNVERGPASIESTFETIMAEPFAVEKIKEGEERGFDAVAISCMCDCGLHPGRELVEIPVTGAFESSVLLASSLGQKFSIVTISKGIIPLFQSLIRSIGLEANNTSFRAEQGPRENQEGPTRRGEEGRGRRWSSRHHSRMHRDDRLGALAAKTA